MTSFEFFLWERLLKSYVVLLKIARSSYIYQNVNRIVFRYKLCELWSCCLPVYESVVVIGWDRVEVNNIITVECRDISTPPLPPHTKMAPAYRRNNERSCVLFVKILLEYQFFTEMLKQVRGSVNEYEDTLV